MNDQNQSPKPCSVTGCDFFGNQMTSYMCSKHYRDSQKNQQMENKQQKQLEEKISQTLQTNQITQNQTQPISIPIQSNATVSSTPIETTTSISSSPSKEAKDVKDPQQPLQKDTSKCFSCNKRVGLLGFECRCKLTFCSSHRFPDQHACTFDFQQMQREKLTLQNQKVEASKIQNRI